jgi:hypothetical protein
VLLGGREKLLIAQGACAQPLSADLAEGLHKSITTYSWGKIQLATSPGCPLLNGTWARASAIRLAWWSAGAPVIGDAVIFGHDQTYVPALAWPNAAACQRLLPELAGLIVGALAGAGLCATRHLQGGTRDDDVDEPRFGHVLPIPSLVMRLKGSYNRSRYRKNGPTHAPRAYSRACWPQAVTGTCAAPMSAMPVGGLWICGRCGCAAPAGLPWTTLRVTHRAHRRPQAPQPSTTCSRQD